MMLLAACAAEEVPAPPAEALIDADAPRLLRRLSLDLRGVLPSTGELDAVEADSGAIASYRDAWLDDPALEDRLVSLLAERWSTRVDDFDGEYYDFGLDASEEYAFEEAIGEEPLRLAARIVADGRPWTDIVTADHTVANEMLGRIWPLDYPDDQTGWLESRYTDDRPAAGVLTTNGLWWRYITNTFNNNRTRAAAIFRLLLCEDVLQRPVSFSASAALADGIESEEAIKTQAYCVTCHVSIEPVAAMFYGFWWQAQYSAVEMSTYHAEREPLGPAELEVEPAWFGDPVYGLVDLGAHIAQDSRFHQCAAETMAAALWRREVEKEDLDRLTSFRARYEADGYSMKSMIAAVTDDEVYRVGEFGEAATAEQRDRELTERLLSVDQWASVSQDLSGFSWETNGAEELGNDITGYRVLGGGVNGVNVTRPQQVPGLTWAAVVNRLAQATAAGIVANDLGGGERRLLTQVTAETTPDSEGFAAELDALHWRLYARRADAGWREEITTLWSAVAAEEGAATAWTALLTAMLRDPAFVST